MQFRRIKICGLLIALAVAHQASAANDIKVMAWNTKTSSAVTTVGTRSDGAVWFQCNGSSTNACAFLLFREDCGPGKSNAGPAAMCPAKELGRFNVKVGQTREEKEHLPFDVQVCAGGEAPLSSPLCKKQGKLVAAPNGPQ